MYAEISSFNITLSYCDIVNNLIFCCLYYVRGDTDIAGRQTEIRYDTVDLRALKS